MEGFGRQKQVLMFFFFGGGGGAGGSCLPRHDRGFAS